MFHFETNDYFSFVFVGINARTVPIRGKIKEEGHLQIANDKCTAPPFSGFDSEIYFT